MEQTPNIKPPLSITERLDAAATNSDLPRGSIAVTARDAISEIKRLKAVNENDRAKVAMGIAGIFDAIRQHEWLRLGRGSYEYDDDKWQDEFSQAIDKIVKAIDPLRAVATDHTDCPISKADIEAALVQAGEENEAFLNSVKVDPKTLNDPTTI